MPGSLETLTQAACSGWAAHPRHDGYPMVVHVLAGGKVVASGLADLPRADGRKGFALRFRGQAASARLHVMLGETDEYLPHPPQVASTAREAPRPAMSSVETLIATPTRRPWVNGGCHLDAAQAGLLPETLIDLLCRDYLGQPANPVVTATAMSRLRQGLGLDAVRRGLLASPQYRQRQIHADQAPGAVFSQAMVLSVAAQDFVSAVARPGREDASHLVKVSVRRLLRLQGEAFLTACYRQILRKEPDRGGLDYYMQKMASGMSGLEVTKHLATEFEAINAGVQLIDLPAE